MLQVNFIMIYIILEISVLLKITRIKKNHFFFSQHIMMGNSRSKEENIIKDVRNLFRLEKLKEK